MGLEVPPKVNEDLKAKIVRAALLKKYQTEELFVLKTAQFQGTRRERVFENNDSQDLKILHIEALWCLDPIIPLPPPVRPLPP